MIVDRNTAPAIELTDWSSLADTSTGIVERRHDEDTGLEILFHRMPRTNNDDAMVSVSHALSAWRDGRLVFLVQLESLDLRTMASALGVPVKQLMAEYDSHSVLAPAHTLIYGNGEREDLGVYLGEKDEARIFDFMYDLFSDSFVEEESGDWSDWIYDEDDDEK